MPRENPLAGMVSGLSPEDFALLSTAVRERECREAVGFGTFAEAAALYRPNPPCPRCRSENARLDGREDNGLQRFRCLACGRRHDSLAGTVLEHSKSDMPTWVQFVRLMRFNVPLDAIAEVCGVSHQTAWEWRHRVFATVDGYQDRLVLRDRVWIDETYLVDTDLTHGFGQARKRGLSRQQLCIAVAIDVHKNPVAVVCGHGKPSSKRIKDALASRIAEGATIVGDKERAHNALVKAVKGTHEAYKADIRDPVYLERVAMVNNLCSWIKRYLWRFTGMEMKNLQSYLNWYVYLFRVKQAKERWPEIARVVRHLLMIDSRFRSSRVR
jgi:transposase-like protein